MWMCLQPPIILPCSMQWGLKWCRLSLWLIEMLQRGTASSRCLRTSSNFQSSLPKDPLDVYLVVGCLSEQCSRLCHLMWHLKMSNRVVVLDTTVLCCLLRVPGKDEAGPVEDRWDHDRIRSLLDQEKQAGSTFVLPLASIIETGNHIANAPGDRYKISQTFCDYLRAAANSESPWAAFGDQQDLWSGDGLTRLADTWPALAATGLSIGDTTIKDVADYYARSGAYVQILTGDQGL